MSGFPCEMVLKINPQLSGETEVVWVTETIVLLMWKILKNKLNNEVESTVA